MASTMASKVRSQIVKILEDLTFLIIITPFLEKTLLQITTFLR